ncbi:hypothetical protein [Plasmodium yoelii yoelii]|uniref:Uncharacterized protein n=1 Tax=Plasmodium yoelii yoelii TaxID=73239 RepID=Q7RRJ3_PLAYO|nr:hypothetical protein [Plasmodium yoelii yoelii]
MRINFFKEKNKIKLNKNHNFDSDNTFSNENPESNKCLASISGIILNKKKLKKCIML